MNLTWTRRILDFPVRAAAVSDFLCDLRARGTGDLNAVMTTLNEGGLCREALAALDRERLDRGGAEHAASGPARARRSTAR